MRIARSSLRLPRTALILFAAATLLVAAAGGWADSGRADNGSLVGQLLVAAPTIADPRFSHTVILLLRQDDTGAFGIVLNRPVEQRSIATC